MYSLPHTVYECRLVIYLRHMNLTTLIFETNALSCTQQGGWLWSMVQNTTLVFKPIEPSLRSLIQHEVMKMYVCNANQAEDMSSLSEKNELSQQILCIKSACSIDGQGDTGFTFVYLYPSDIRFWQPANPLPSIRLCLPEGWGAKIAWISVCVQTRETNAEIGWV